jgi:hypothetical protein
MSSSNNVRTTLLPLLLSLVTLLPVTAAAGDFNVPSVATPTLQDAVDAAAGGVDPLETIYINSNLDVGTTTTIGLGFDATHRLLIRPGITLTRATIRMMVPSLIVIQAIGASYVTIQDLDVFRHITNDNHIIHYDGCSEMTIERCRVGSDWTTSGTPGWAAIHWVYPFDCVIRNTFTFATTPSTFAYGMQIIGHDDPGSILRMYNNSVQGFYTAGISVHGTAGKVLFRNNVAVTEQSINPDPVGYNGNLGAVTLVSSHNAVFCDAGDEWGGVTDIRGGSFVRLNFADLPACFTSWLWVFSNPNMTFLNLTGGGPIHTAASAGVTITNGAPDADDTAVVDDWEKNVRPAGTPLHTDRGADQSDLDYLLSVENSLPPAGLSLEIAPLPSHGPVDLDVRGTGGDAVTVRLFDATGRFVTEIWSGRTDGGRAIRWDGASLSSGVYFVTVRAGDRAVVKRIVNVR